VFFSRPDVVEQAKFDARSVLRKNSEVDAVPHPRGAQRIWITEESPYWSHKRAAHLCGIERALAIANGGNQIRFRANIGLSPNRRSAPKGTTVEIRP
jgi:hypothetical protein